MRRCLVAVGNGPNRCLLQQGRRPEVDARLQGGSAWRSAEVGRRPQPFRLALALLP